MDKSNRNVALFLLFFIIVTAQNPSVTGEKTDHNQDEKPPLTKILRRTISMLKHSHQSSWEKLKTAIHEIQFRYFPPNLEGSNEENHISGTGSGGTMKRAAGNSFKTSKEAFKGSAKSASEILGKTVHKTAKKGRNGVPVADAEL